MTTLPEKLSREIERVTIVRAAWRMADRLSGIDSVADITIMTAAIEAGHRAAGGGDPIEMIAAIRRLEGFKE